MWPASVSCINTNTSHSDDRLHSSLLYQPLPMPSVQLSCLSVRLSVTLACVTAAKKHQNSPEVRGSISLFGIRIRVPIFHYLPTIGLGYTFTASFAPTILTKANRAKTNCNRYLPDADRETLRYDTIRQKSLTWTRKLSIQLYLAHVARTKKLKQTNASAPLIKYNYRLRSVKAVR